MKKSDRILKALFIIALIVFSLMDGYLVWNQCSPDGDNTYMSDMNAHIKMSLQPHAYSFFNVVLRVACIFFGENMYILTVLCTALMVASNVASVLILHHMYKRLYNNSDWRSGLFSFTSVFVVAFFSDYYSLNVDYVAGYANVWHGPVTGYANVWHSPTLLMARPFMLFVIFETIMIFKNAKEGKPIGKHLVYNAIASLFCMWAKPSFFASFLPALCLYLLIELVRTKGKSFLFSLKLGLSYLGIVPFLIYQYIALFIYAPTQIQTEETTSVFFKTNWTAEEVLHAVYNELFSSWFIIIGIVLLLVFRKTNKKILAFTGIYWVISDVFYYFVKESGFRAGHGNFTWSRIAMLYVMMAFVAGEVFLKPAENDIPRKWKALAGVVYAGHLITGCIYFWSLVNGLHYFYISRML